MDTKCVKKSTIQQQALVEFMEENAEFARGAPVFGRSKNSVEDMWKNLSTKLNSFGPPSRTIAEWKKTWADLKSRTKKKIAENKKGMEGTGGGLYRVNVLSDMEQIIDRTLFLSAAAAPSGRVFGYENDIDNCFQSLVETPPRGTKAVAVVTPSRQQEDSQQPSCSKQQQPAVSIKTPPTQRYRPPQQSVDEIEGEVPPCSSAKKRRVCDEQISLFRRQLRVSEKSAAVAKEQVDAANILCTAAKRMADAAEVQAEAAKRSAAAAERTADAAEAQTNILKSLAFSLFLIQKK